MDKETWDMGAQAVKAIKERYYYNGKDTTAKQLNSYRKLSLTERIKRIDELLRTSRMFPSYYAALEAIVHYHVENDDDPEDIPPALLKWVMGVHTGWIDRPKCDPENLRLISYRNMAIIHSMIILVEFEGWSMLQAATLISKTIGRIPDSENVTSETIDPSVKMIDVIWDKAVKNRNNPDMPEYMGFFIHHAGDGQKQIYEAWKENGFSMYVA